MSVNKGGAGGELSALEGLAKLRDAAASGSIATFEQVVTEMYQAKGFWGGFWGGFWEKLRLHTAICTNYNNIIRVADQILDSDASAADKEWAQGQKDKANAGKERHGCGGPNVS